MAQRWRNVELSTVSLRWPNGQNYVASTSQIYVGPTVPSTLGQRSCAIWACVSPNSNEMAGNTENIGILPPTKAACECGRWHLYCARFEIHVWELINGNTQCQPRQWQLACYTNIVIVPVCKVLEPHASRPGAISGAGDKNKGLISLPCNIRRCAPRG